MKRDRIKMPILPPAEVVNGEGQRQIIGENITWKDPRKVKFIALASKGCYLYALDDHSELWYTQNNAGDEFHWRKVAINEFEKEK